MIYQANLCARSLLVVAAGMALTACDAPPTPTAPAAGAAAAAPNIVFAETAHDFGQAKSGDVLEHTFRFTNRGEGDLLLEQPKGS